MVLLLNNIIQIARGIIIRNISLEMFMDSRIKPKTNKDDYKLIN